MKLYIAEKPSLAEAIASGIGQYSKSKSSGFYKIENKDIIVTWSYGHILKTKEPNEYDPKYEKWNINDLPIFPAKWELKVSTEAEKQFNIIKKLISEADVIVNAGDPDREGQLLVDEILTFVNNQKPVRRILLNALDEKSVKYALNDEKDNKEFKGLRNSALARSQADWLIGMNLTRCYTLIGNEGVLSIGRVQTPTMALIVNRESEIKNFKSTTHYKLDVMWQHPNGKINSTWQPSNDNPNLDSEGYILDKNVTVDILNYVKNLSTDNCKIKKRDITKKTELPLLPYSLSALQIAAGKKYGYDPQTVLNICQKLYESKYTTYPRSDCDYLPTNQLEDVEIIFKNLNKIDEMKNITTSADINLRSKAWNDSKISAHHAIIPTRNKCNISSLSQDEINIYFMISTAYIAQFYPEHIYSSTKLFIEAGNEIFTSTGKSILQIGWKVLYQAAEKDDNEDADNELPVAEKDDFVIFDSGNSKELNTKPPKRFTTATLLQAMKNIYKFVKTPELKKQLKNVSGIGTEATRAGIIDNLIKRGYVIVDKKLLKPTDKAIQVVNVLPDEMKYPDLTAIWEEQLEGISKNEVNPREFIQTQSSFIKKIISDAKTKKLNIDSVNGVKCPTCGNPMRRIKNKDGKYFWGCSAYPDCKTMFDDIKNKPAIHKCPTCKKSYLKRITSKKNNKKYWICQDSNCKTIFPDSAGKPDIKKKSRGRN